MQSICSYRTRSNLRNVLIIGMQDLIDSNLWNEWIFEKPDNSNCLNWLSHYMAKIVVRVWQH